MAEASMVFKAYDEMSGIMKGIAGSGKALSKEYEALERRMNALSSGSEQFQRKMGTLSKKIVEAKNTMKDAETQFKKTGDEADGISLKKAVAEYERLSAEMKETKAAADTLQRSMKNTAEDMRKTFDGGFHSKETGILEKLAGSGLLKMAGDSVANFVGMTMESSLGQPLATFTSQTLSGAASGAAAGALLGPMGAFGGALFGAVSGVVNGYTQIAQQQDDAFKSYHVKGAQVVE